MANLTFLLCTKAVVAGPPTMRATAMAVTNAAAASHTTTIEMEKASKSPSKTTARGKSARYLPTKKAPASSKPNNKSPPERRTEQPPSKTAASKGGSRKLLKTAKQNNFKMVAEKSKPDPLVMKCVASYVDDEYSGSNIIHNF